MLAVDAVAVLVMVLSVAILGGAIGLAWSLRRELHELRGELVGLRADVGTARAEVGTVRADVAEVRRELGGARERIERIESWVVRGAPPPRDGRH